MDDFDRKILALHQHDTRRVAESIGAEVGLSPAAVQRRLKRLRDDGVIRANLAVLDGAAVGAPITCIVTLAMASAPHELASFKRAMREQPLVQQCYQVTGASDFVLVVAAASIEAYGAFAREWFEANAQVSRYETYVVLDPVKVGLSVPVAATRKARS